MGHWDKFNIVSIHDTVRRWCESCNLGIAYSDGRGAAKFSEFLT